MAVIVAACGGGNDGGANASSSAEGDSGASTATTGNTGDGGARGNSGGSNTGAGGSGAGSAGVSSEGGASSGGASSGSGSSSGGGGGSDDAGTTNGGSGNSGGTEGNDGTGGGSGNSGGSNAGGSGSGGDAGGGGTGGVVDDAAVEIVILGASSAAGKNLDQPMYGGQAGGLVDSWPNRLAASLASERPGSVVVNLAKSGYNTYHALPTGTVNPNGAPAVDTARNVTAALAENPDALIVSFPGGSEVDVGDTADDIVDNLRIISDTAALQGVLTWVATTQPHVDQTPADTTFGLGFRQAVLDEFGSFALDFWTPLALSEDSGAEPTLLLTDNIHPNKLGHEALYNVVLAADIPNVALAP